MSDHYSKELDVKLTEHEICLILMQLCNGLAYPEIRQIGAKLAKSTSKEWQKVFPEGA